MALIAGASAWSGGGGEEPVAMAAVAEDTVGWVQVGVDEDTGKAGLPHVVRFHRRQWADVRADAVDTSGRGRRPEAV